MAKVPQLCMHIKHVLRLESILMLSCLFEPGVSLTVWIQCYHQ